LFRQFAGAARQPHGFVDQFGGEGRIALSDGNGQAVAGFGLETEGTGRGYAGFTDGLHNPPNAPETTEFRGLSRRNDRLQTADEIARRHSSRRPIEIVARG
jgi:hypothetical protein